ncbi:hypothetical protein DAETH_22920 [Deinococcus aetherius]|uniref:Uncharacterized protein n=1 Tax=Deinococcus aetherius TaxID=200252 RepID=A0ABM8AEU8_9DEIO|nr:hypothetical protein [Deinococcus aetherius]BDP42323.1 hypothetical protein DAETH_22920 [Deinococcus aetherius]
MNSRSLAAPLASLLLAALSPLAPAQTSPRQPTALQQARVLVARETAQVRLLERTGLLHPLRVSRRCADRLGRVRLTVLADVRNTPRIVRYRRALPGNNVQFTGYYDATGRLRYATARASGSSGVRYNLAAEYDVRGRLLRETGIRRPGYVTELRRQPGLHVESLRRGLCPG